MKIPTKIPKIYLVKFIKSLFKLCIKKLIQACAHSFLFHKNKYLYDLKIEVLDLFSPPHFSLFLVTGGILSPESLCSQDAGQLRSGLRRHKRESHTFKVWKRGGKFNINRQTLLILNAKEFKVPIYVHIQLYKYQMNMNIKQT